MSASTGGKRLPRPRINAEVKAVIRDLRAQGMTMSEIGRRVGISRPSVSRFLAQMGDPDERPGPKRCSLDGCERGSNYGPLGYCRMHEMRYKRGVPLDAPLMRAPNGQRTPCVVEGCDRPRGGRGGYCPGHARRVRTGGEMVPEFEPRMKQPDKCTFPGCTRRADSKGYCPAHIRQQRVHGRMVAIRERTVWDTCTYSAVHDEVVISLDNLNQLKKAIAAERAAADRRADDHKAKLWGFAWTGTLATLVAIATLG
jgi:hypothetical protein